MDMSERVADDFSRIYSNEWREARASLSSEKHEEEIIYLLMRIVRVGVVVLYYFVFLFYFWKVF